jgi:hypothetical protein
LAAVVRDEPDQAARDPVTKKGVAAGVAIAALYIVVAQLSFNGGLVPVRPLYDGTGPLPPYRWVNPPSSLSHGNTPPSSATGSVKIGPKHTPAYNLNTDDGQASLIFPPDGIVPMAGQTSVKVVIKPLDPAKVAPPPAGLDYDGNAYSITGTYQPSGKPVQIPKAVCSLNNANACATIVLRYAFSATKLFVLNGQTWTPAQSQIASSALQIYGLSDQLGTFVAAEPHIPGGQKPKGQTGNIIAFAVGVAAILLGTFAARLRATRKRRAREAARQKGSKQKQPQRKQPPKQKRPKKPQKRPPTEEEEKPWWRD